MKQRITVFSPLFVAAATLGFCAALAQAGVQFHTGNIQYTNINFAADSHDFTIVGEVDHLGVLVDFRGFGAGPSFAPVEVHGQHGVAFVEAFNPMDQLYRFTISAQAGYAFANIDWKLDAVPPFDGLVTFMALDAMNAPIPLSTGTDTFFFTHNGQNPLHAHADAGTPISTLVITSTVPMLDLKQVSVDLVPAPGVAGVLSLGLLMGVRRRR